MTDLNNDPAIHEDESDDVTTSSQGVMLTTMLLLIGGLMLTSVMLLHYGFKQSGNTDASKQGLGQAWAQFKAQVSERQTAQETVTTTQSPDTLEPASKSSGLNIKNWFSRNSDGQVRWPRLKLSGFGLPSAGEVSFAIINEKQVVEGSVINGAKVVKIQEHGVVMEYKGETKTLIVEITER